MVSLEATCPLVASPFCPLSSGRGGGQQREPALGGLEVRGEGTVGPWVRTKPMSMARPLVLRSGGPRCARAAVPKLLSPVEAQGEPSSTRKHQGFSSSFLFWLGAVALPATALWSVGAGERKGWRKGVGRSQRHTPLSRASRRKSDHRTVAAAAKETFSPRAARFQRPLPTQLAGSLSTFLQTGSLAVTGFQPGRGLGESSAYGGALAGASRWGAWSVFPSPLPPHPTPDPLHLRLWTDFERAGCFAQFFAHCLLIKRCVCVGLLKSVLDINRLSCIFLGC